MAAKLNRTLASNALLLTLLTIVVVGALNWLLIALFDYDLVVAITGGRQPKVDYKTATRAIYGVIGAAAVLLVVVMAMRK